MRSSHSHQTVYHWFFRVWLLLLLFLSRLGNARTLKKEQPLDLTHALYEPPNPASALRTHCSAFTLKTPTVRFESGFESLFDNAEDYEKTKQRLQKYLTMSLLRLADRYPADRIQKVIAYTEIVIAHPSQHPSFQKASAATPGNALQIILYLPEDATFELLDHLVENEMFVCVVRDIHLDRIGYTPQDFYKLSSTIKSRLLLPFLDVSGELDEQLYTDYRNAIVELQNNFIELFNHPAWKKPILDAVSAYSAPLYPISCSGSECEQIISILLKSLPTSTFYSFSTRNIPPFSKFENNLFHRSCMPSMNSEQKLAGLYFDFSTRTNRLNQSPYKEKGPAMQLTELGSDIAEIFPIAFEKLVAPLHASFMRDREQEAQMAGDAAKKICKSYRP